MCSLGTYFLIARKLDRYLAKATALRKEFASHANELKPRVSETNCQDELLTCFDGSTADAFDTLNNKVEELERKFMPVTQLLENSAMLRDDSKLFQKGVTIENVFSILFGSKSCFCERFHKLRGDKELRFHPPRPLVGEGAPWGAYDKLTCKVPVQVLGLCHYDEVRRFVLCRQRDSVTLAMQQVGKVRAGFYGEITVELLYLFTQVGNDDTVRMQVFALAPRGYFASQTLEGYRKSVEDFCKVAAEAMQERGHNIHTEGMLLSDPNRLKLSRTSEDRFT